MLAIAATAAVAGAITIAVAFVRAENPAPIASFNLSDQSGAPVTERDFAGRHLLVFFGFTNCAQACPTQMAKLSAAMAELQQSGHADDITPVFVSVDPERDTPEQVAHFLDQYDQRFVGLTGSRPALAAAAATFKAYLQGAPIPGARDYDVVHASTVYIVDPDSRIIDTVAGSTDARGIAAKVRKTLG